jgi:hypothetical protein
MFSSLKAKAGLVFSAVMVVALTVVQGASAALTVDAKDFTEPVEEQLTTAVPIVVGFIAAVFAIGLVIRWVMKRARSAS